MDGLLELALSPVRERRAALEVLLALEDDLNPLVRLAYGDEGLRARHLVIDRLGAGMALRMQVPVSGDRERGQFGLGAQVLLRALVEGPLPKATVQWGFNWCEVNAHKFFSFGPVPAAAADGCWAQFESAERGESIGGSPLSRALEILGVLGLGAEIGRCTSSLVYVAAMGPHLGAIMRGPAGDVAGIEKICDEDEPAMIPTTLASALVLGVERLHVERALADIDKGVTIACKGGLEAEVMVKEIPGPLQEIASGLHSVVEGSVSRTELGKAARAAKSEVVRVDKAGQVGDGVPVRTADLLRALAALSGTREVRVGEGPGYLEIAREIAPGWSCSVLLHESGK